MAKDHLPYPLFRALTSIFQEDPYQSYSISIAKSDAALATSTSSIFQMLTLKESWCPSQSAPITAPIRHPYHPVKARWKRKSRKMLIRVRANCSAYLEDSRLQFKHVHHESMGSSYGTPSGRSIWSAVWIYDCLWPYDYPYPQWSIWWCRYAQYSWLL